MNLLRIGWGILAAASLAMPACEDSGDEDGGTEGGDGTTAASSMDSSTAPVTTSPSTTGPIDCIPGQETCECLEGDCLGNLFCVDNICAPGPEFDVPDDPIRVIAGLRVPIEAEVNADEFSWEQSGGPSADLSDLSNPTLLVDVPADASAGDTLTLTLNATRNSVPASAEVQIEVVAASFGEGLPGIEDIEQLGTPVGIDFRGGELWAISSEGFVSWFDLDFDEESMTDVAFHVGSHDIPGAPGGGQLGQVPGNDDDIDVLLLANTANQAIEAVAVNGGSIQTITDETIDAEPLGAVRDVIGLDGALYFTNAEGGQLMVWDPDPPGDPEDEDAIPPGTRVLLSDLSMPSALAIGPEPGVLYLGTTGRVWRVPILEDGSAGSPTVYLDIGDEADLDLEVGGLRFDRGQNLYVGLPLANRLLVARYVANDETEAVRDFGNADEGFNAFSQLSFGDGDFGGGTLYYGNPGGRVGRVYVGLGD